jgi:polar amino acid transport system substrate-binding protein
MLRHWPVLLIICASGSCGMPRDPERTSERIATAHVLRVGVTDNPPWTDARSAEPQGLEPALVRKFARKTGARVVWTRGSETSLAQLLKRHELDLAIGGFDAKSPWKSIAGVSQPFAQTADKKKHVFLAPPGENRFMLTLDTFLSEYKRSSEGESA